MSEPAASLPATAGPGIPGAGGAPASALRRAILLHLRRAGPTAPDAIAVALGASRSGVAQQLRALDAAGLVTRTTVRHGVGRPRHLYDVTPLAQDLFPSNYDGLATGLLAAILEIGGDALLEDVFAARRRQSEVRLRQELDATLPPGASLVDRVRELARLQDELGYLAEARVDADGIRLLEHNCAVLDVASANPAACQAELELFRSVLGADVERVRHIAAGDRCCDYRVGPVGATEG
ncbi:MAG TPA: helix-turn-helix domain-containing protein [Candidatus Limnocylindrales bacterium]|nr:helix-turn-helix domain-containing protein [Candidatus Limnocylindrales bacterium]